MTAQLGFSSDAMVTVEAAKLEAAKLEGAERDAIIQQTMAKLKAAKLEAAKLEAAKLASHASQHVPEPEVRRRRPECKRVMSSDSWPLSERISETNGL